MRTITAGLSQAGQPPRSGFALARRGLGLGLGLALGHLALGLARGDRLGLGAQ